MIVLAEDDPKLRKLYTDFLEVNGFTVAAAKDGNEVLGLLHVITPMVLILDIMMPIMDGIETCRRARKIIGGNVPIMFLTAVDNLDRLQECMEAGGDDYVTKTQPLERILERVKHWSRRSARQNMMIRRPHTRREVSDAIESRKRQSDCDSLVTAIHEIIREM
jgi:DNA-binding response OmpR family regulator